MSNTPSGMVLIDKPSEMTSFGVVARVRRIVSQQAGRRVKVGHAGTLDPFATGLLVLLIGSATREAGNFLKLDKTYEVTAVLGYTSATGDPEGELSAVSPRQPSIDEVREALQEFTGEISQTPPIYSAIKVGGVRAYHLARAGKEVLLQSRPVTIYRLELKEYVYPHLQIVCEVSSGTYIRSLVQDIGERLGTGAYTKVLRRTRIADFRVEDAQELPLDADVLRILPLPERKH